MELIEDVHDRFNRYKLQNQPSNVTSMHVTDYCSSRTVHGGPVAHGQN